MCSEYTHVYAPVENFANLTTKFDTPRQRRALSPATLNFNFDFFQRNDSLECKTLCPLRCAINCKNNDCSRHTMTYMLNNSDYRAEYTFRIHREIV